MDPSELRSWFRLSRLEIAPRKAADLLERFGGPEAIFAAKESELRSVEGLTGRAVEKLLAPEPADLDSTLSALTDSGIKFVSVRDPEYPSNLRQIYDPPVVLYVRGELRESERFSIAIVGSRRASIYGKSIAERIAKDLADRGLSIVSGGARGIDAAAHNGALSVGGHTVAVLGCGIDVPYPSEHKALFDKIAESGAVISEFPPGTKPEAWRFPTRNRIISGLCVGVLVVQAPIDSGALITARFAAEQGRDVFALPGNVDDIRNQGSHSLIKDGAALIESATDILEHLGVSAEAEHKPQLALQFSSLSADERRLVDLLSLQPKHVDQIIHESEMSAPSVTGTLTLLEMKGIVKRVPGNAYVRAL
ncbi:MAG: DNA-protecting protein DprA [Armatimonadetes bacterium]|nr:DNA-protecting protein DprA [Armatimonadota bacterium]